VFSETDKTLNRTSPTNQQSGHEEALPALG